MKLEKITKKSPALDKRWYDDACGTALGLELLGERWSLLIVRDMMLRKHLSADKSLELNRLFVEYQKFFGETQKLGKEILRQLAG